MSVSGMLPAQYVGFDELNFCSNLFRNVVIPLGINGQPLVLIGKGAPPQVWLAAPSQPNASTWVYVVKESRASNPGIAVNWSAATQQLSVDVAQTSVLTVRIESAERATVVALNLRPLGLDVVGSPSGIMIGTNQFAHNSVIGSRVGLNLNVPGAQVVQT